MIPDTSKLVLGEAAVGDDELDTRILREMNEEAKSYLLRFRWCKSIRQSLFGDGFGGIIAAFLIQIEPAVSDVDEWLWVIVGNVPPVYLVTDEIQDAGQALQTYVDLMREWVGAVEKGLPTEKLVPVNAPATAESAVALKTRLDAVEQLGLYALSRKG
jgi:hypothetical protein